MSLTPYQEALLTETHAVAVTTKTLVEIHMAELASAKARVTTLEKKLDKFMGAWIIVTGLAGAVFAWFLKSEGI